jgi:hypothetical protein
VALFPRFPLATGVSKFQFKLDEQRAISQGEGLIAIRKRTRARYTAIQVEWDLTAEDLATFEAFYKVQTKKGMLWYGLLLPIPQNEELGSLSVKSLVRFASPYKTTQTTTGVKVTVDLDWDRTRYLEDDELEPTCVLVDTDYSWSRLLLRGQDLGDDPTTIIDSSPYGYSHVAQGAVVISGEQSLPCFGSTSVKFSGSDSLAYNDPVDLLDFTAEPKFTMEAWVCAGHASSGMGIISRRPNNATGFAFQTDSFRANIGGVYSDAWLDAGGRPAVNVWTHRAVVKNLNDFLYWRDGVLADSRLGTAGYIVNGSSGNSRVGASTNNNNEAPFVGHMYVRFYRGVAKYLAPFTPPNNFPANT